jgi:hypothetical protein
MNNIKSILFSPSVTNNIDSPTLQNANQKTTKFSCFHVCYVECFEPALAEQSSAITKISCPICKENIKAENIKQCDNIRNVKIDLLAECKQKNYFANINAENNKKNMKLCQYPVVHFPYQSPNNFLTKNSTEIIQWLQHQFSKTKLSDVTISYVKKEFLSLDMPSFNYKPFISVVVEGVPIVCSSVTINKGKNSQECFNILLRELRCSLQACYLMKNYPNIFNSKTKVSISFSTDAENAIFLKINNEEKVIPCCDQVFDVDNKIINWDRLRELINTDGKDYYSELFSGKHLINENNLDDMNFDSLYPSTISSEVEISENSREQENGMQSKEPFVNIPYGCVSIAEYMI